jgi:hypothetical protein
MDAISDMEISHIVLGFCRCKKGLGMSFSGINQETVVLSTEYCASCRGQRSTASFSYTTERVEIRLSTQTA